MQQRIYVACLASYSNGIYHGVWLDVTTAEDMRATIERMLQTSPCSNAEEWEVHDHEGFDMVRPSPRTPLEIWGALARLVSGEDSAAAELLETWAESLLPSWVGGLARVQIDPSRVRETLSSHSANEVAE